MPASFEDAEMEVGFVKAGFFGFQGSGKSITMGLLALGLSLEFHNGAPVGMHDTETGSDFLAPIYKIEGVRLVRRKSKSFQDSCDLLHLAQEQGCCAFLEDSISHTWDDLQDSYMLEAKRKALQFQDWKYLKQKWNDLWVEPMINAAMHVLVAGRAGFEYDSQEKDDGSGRMEIIQGDTKMNAEKQYGHEPNLLVEMIQRRVTGEEITPTRGRNRGDKKKSGEKKGVMGGKYIHEAHILKDRTWALNGQTIIFQGATAYQKGDYKRVLDAFRPHIERLNMGHHKGLAAKNTVVTTFTDMSRDDEFWRMKRHREVQVETFDGTLEKYWPGTSAKAKQAKAAVTEYLFRIRSHAALEELALWKVLVGTRALLNFDQRVREGATIPEEWEFLEIMLQECAKSVDQQKAKMDAEDMKAGRISITQASDIDQNFAGAPAPTDDIPF